jgi:hypothetical protein
MRRQALNMRQKVQTEPHITRHARGPSSGSLRQDKAAGATSGARVNQRNFSCNDMCNNNHDWTVIHQAPGLQQTSLGTVPEFPRDDKSKGGCH